MTKHIYDKKKMSPRFSKATSIVNWTSIAFVSCCNLPIDFSAWVGIKVHPGRLCSSASSELTLKASNLFPSCAQLPVHNSTTAANTRRGLDRCCWVSVGPAVKPCPGCPTPRAVDVVAVVGHFLMTLSTLTQSICTWPPDMVSGPAQGIWTQFY